MTDMTPAQLEAIAEEMRVEATNIAYAWLEMADMTDGPLLTTNTDRDVFECGVQAGYIGALQMLQKRGLLPGLETNT